MQCNQSEYILYDTKSGEVVWRSLPFDSPKPVVSMKSATAAFRAFNPNLKLYVTVIFNEQS